MTWKLIACGLRALKRLRCTVDGELISTYDLSFVDNAESICVDRANECVWVGSDEDNTKLYKIDIDFKK